MNRNSLTTLYNSFLLPYLYYSIHVWGGTYSSYLSPLYILQRKAVRCICFLRKFDRVSSKFSEFSFLSIYSIYKYELIIFMYKYHKDLLPKVFKNYFVRNNQIHTYNTRNANKFRTPLFKSCLGQNSFYYNSTKNWNETGIRLIDHQKNESFSYYKRKLKTHLLNNQLL